MALLVAAVFVALALWHVFMALSPGKGKGGAVPAVDGKPLFVPGTRATLSVALALALFAVLVAGAGGLIALPLPMAWLSGLCYVLAAGLLARAVGEFRYVGFFKQIRGTRFATLDSFFYSPLCLGLAIAVALVASGHAG